MNRRGENIRNPRYEELAYLYHLYPTGIGLDSDLIRRLEGDTIVRNKNLEFEHIAGSFEAKRILHESVICPLHMPDQFRCQIPQGILMFGPSGVGKTTLAKSLASQTRYTFFNVLTYFLVYRWRNQSTKIIKILFEMAQFYAPSIVFLDELNAVAPKRDQHNCRIHREAKAELLARLDEVYRNNQSSDKIIIVLAATTNPWDIDEDLIQRMQKKIFVSLPTKSERKMIFDMHLEYLTLEPQVDLNSLATQSEGYTGSDIADYCKNVAMIPIRKKLALLKHSAVSSIALERMKHQFSEAISMEELTMTLQSTRQTIDEIELEKYKKWYEEFRDS